MTVREGRDVLLAPAWREGCTAARPFCEEERLGVTVRLCVVERLGAAVERLEDVERDG